MVDGEIVGTFRLEAYYCSTGVYSPLISCLRLGLSYTGLSNHVFVDFDP